MGAFVPYRQAGNAPPKFSYDKAGTPDPRSEWQRAEDTRLGEIIARETQSQARIRAPGYVRKYSGAAKLAKQPDETDMYLRALSLMNTQKMMRRSNNPGALGTF